MMVEFPENMSHSTRHILQNGDKLIHQFWGNRALFAIAVHNLFWNLSAKICKY